MGTLLLLLVLRPGPSPEVLTAARAALTQILGARVTLVVEDAPASLTEEDVTRRQARDHADLAAAIEVVEDDVLRVSVRRAGEAAPTRHTLSFEVSDAASERGRALGYAIASMLPPVWLEGSARERELDASARGHFSFALAPEIALGLGSSAAPFGGRIAVDWDFCSRWAIEAVAAYRLGTLEVARSTYSHAFAGAGVAFHLLAPAPRTRWGASGRLVAGVVRHDADHFDGEDEKNAVHGSAWMPGAVFGGEADWWFSASAAILLALDVETDAGTVAIYRLDQRNATLGPVTVLAAAGLRIRY